MDKSRMLHSLRRARPLHQLPAPSWICTQCLHTLRPLRTTPIKRLPRQRPPRRPASTHEGPQSQPGDSATFQSIVDNPPVLVRSNRRHNVLGLAILATIPVTAFFLGCWQVKRLGWKSEQIARFEDRLIRDPLPLPPQLDPSAIADFDYRRVYARGKFRHDQEMLIGPRIHDGKDGYLVVTPLDRQGSFPDLDLPPGTNTTILVCRGWIPKALAPQDKRPASLPRGEMVVEGLLRQPWKKNMFTPNNKPEEQAWYFPDVVQMAAHTGSQVVWVEVTMRSDLITAYEREAQGRPIGRVAEVDLRNNHAQYIFTWFSLSACTSVMLWMIMRRPMGGGVRGRARLNREW